MQGLTFREFKYKWFDRWLKGIDNGIEKDSPVRYYVMRANKWTRHDVFPPETKNIELYLDFNGNLLNKVPSKPERMGFIYDPKNPVPSLWTVSCFSSAYDLSELKHRHDILWFFSQPLKQDMEIAVILNV